MWFLVVDDNQDEQYKNYRRKHEKAAVLELHASSYLVVLYVGTARYASLTGRARHFLGLAW
jgi:hypothetical protein